MPPRLFWFLRLLFPQFLIYAVIALLLGNWIICLALCLVYLQFNTFYWWLITLEGALPQDMSPTPVNRIQHILTKGKRRFFVWLFLPMVTLFCIYFTVILGGIIDPLSIFGGHIEHTDSAALLGATVLTLCTWSIDCLCLCAGTAGPRRFFSIRIPWQD